MYYPSFFHSKEPMIRDCWYKTRKPRVYINQNSGGSLAAISVYWHSKREHETGV
jgi:hypothetical protein